MPEQEIPLRVGMIGISMEDISAGKDGYGIFPVGKYNIERGEREWVRVKITALESIRERRDIIVADEQLRCKEHTPAEISYEKRDGVLQRVTETTPFPATLESLTQDLTFVTIEATALGNTSIVTPSSGKKIRVKWYSISNKHTTLVDVGMRFGSSGTIKHKYGLAPEGGAVTANLIACNWQGAVDETLYAYLTAAYATGVYFTVGYSEED